MLSTILIILAAIIGILLLIAAVSPKDATMSAETLVNRPNNVVFDYVKHLKNQEKYSK
jgi:hypothetical protein